MQLISHPDHDRGDPHLTLTRHSAVVRNRVERLYRPGPEEARRYAAMAAYLHDFGKATPQFQAYIHPEQTYSGPDEERYHGRLGAYATLYALDAVEAPDVDTLAGTLAVARHHQRLPDAATYLHNTLTDKLVDPESSVRRQIERIDEQWPEEANELLSTATDGLASWPEFLKRVEDETLADRVRSLSARKELTGWYSESEKLPEQLYDRTIHCWGTLTLADKSHAASVSDRELFEYGTLDQEPLNEHIEALQQADPSAHTAQLNEWRQAAREQALAGVHEWVLGSNPPDIATLTLPTGLGKTFTGLSAAFEVRDQLLSPDHTPVIVYALPFTSIIEQTRSHFENPEIWGASPRDSAFTVHHYLSETVVETGYDEADSDGTFLGESWRSGVVLTTFVQLFESLTGPTNGASTKLPALDEAIIILDEPQALPKDWWDGIRRELETLTTEFGAKIISMTATQPALLDPLETVSLLDAGGRHAPSSCSRCSTPADSPAHDRGEYFEQANRVTYHLDDSALAHTLDSTAGYVGHVEAASRLVERATTGASVLSVCNTIASSRALTDRVLQTDEATRHIGAVYERLLRSDEISPGTDLDTAVVRTLRECGFEQTEGGWSFPDVDPPVFVGTFNSRYRPIDRRVLLDVLTTLTTVDVPFVFVSTQAVEAGVDVSFEAVYRDIAPLDSIVQAAGRCNRSFEWGPAAGDVTVWTLADPDEPTPEDPSEPCPASYVYEHGIPGHLRLISQTLAELHESNPIPDDRMAHTGVRQYFDRLSTNRSVSSTEIREEINDCCAGQLGRRSLIQDYDTVDVLVAVTDEDRSLVNSIGDAFDNEEKGKAYEKLEACSDLRVSVPIQGADEDLQSLPRVDRQLRGTEDGVNVLVYTGQSGAEYDMADGGFSPRTTDSVEGRFVI